MQIKATLEFYIEVDPLHNTVKTLVPQECHLDITPRYDAITSFVM